MKCGVLFTGKFRLNSPAAIFKAGSDGKQQGAIGSVGGSPAISPAGAGSLGMARFHGRAGPVGEMNKSPEP
jgi:hypothetical protein